MFSVNDLRCYPDGYGKEVSKLHMMHCSVVDSDDEDAPVNVCRGEQLLVVTDDTWWDDAELAPCIDLLAGAGIKMDNPLRARRMSDDP